VSRTNFEHLRAAGLTYSSRIPPIGDRALKTHLDCASSVLFAADVYLPCSNFEDFEIISSIAVGLVQTRGGLCRHVSSITRAAFPPQGFVQIFLTPSDPSVMETAAQSVLVIRFPLVVVFLVICGKESSLTVLLLMSLVCDLAHSKESMAKGHRRRHLIPSVSGHETANINSPRMQEEKED
jgi:hypothetical protein